MTRTLPRLARGLLLAAALAGVAALAPAGAIALDAGADAVRLRQLAEESAAGQAFPRLALLLLAAWGRGDGPRAYGLSLLRATPPQLEQGRWWLARAARRGDARAAYALALSLRSGEGGPRQPAEAIPWLDLAARGGVGAAHFLLGNAYRDGEGVPVDLRRAVGHYEEAAERENPPAIQALAEAYRSGELGLPRDPTRAEELMRDLEHAVHEPRPTL